MRRKSLTDHLIPLIITFGIVGAFAFGVTGALIGVAIAIFLGSTWHNLVSKHEEKWLKVYCPVCGDIVASIDAKTFKAKFQPPPKWEFTCPDTKCKTRFILLESE